MAKFKRCKLKWFEHLSKFAGLAKAFLQQTVKRSNQKQKKLDKDKKSTHEVHNRLGGHSAAPEKWRIADEKIVYQGY